MVIERHRFSVFEGVIAGAWYRYILRQPDTDLEEFTHQQDAQSISGASQNQLEEKN
jgi:hypothetical protein